MNQTEKKTYVCQYCDKVYKRKAYFEKHIETCEEQEIEIFNYQGLIEEWKDIDPEIAHCFQVEMEKILNGT
mgnify:CR=1 FL=1